MSDTGWPRLAIVGCGAAVELAIMPALRRAGWRPSVIVNPSSRQLKGVGASFGRWLAQAKRSIDWPMVSEKFDAAIVSLAPSFRGGTCAALLGAGKHVLLNKPLPFLNDEDAMHKAACGANATLWYAFPRRHLPAFRWTKALLESEALGEIVKVDIREGAISAVDTKAAVLLPTDWADDGSMRTIGAETLDLALRWFGNIELINYCDDNEGGTESERLLEGRLSSGARLMIEFSRTRHLSNTIRIEGNRGFVEVHLFRNQVIAGSKDALAFRHEGISVQSMRPKFLVELFEAEIGDFRKRIITDRQTIRTDAQRTSINKLIEQCYLERRPLVHPWDELVPDTSINKRAARPTLSTRSKVLVTGATGFIGGRLVERLLRGSGAQVRCTVRGTGREARLARLPVEILNIDLCDAAGVSEALDGVDYVFHCAHDGQSSDQNIGALRNLVAASLKHSVQRLVHISTFAVYEPFPDGPLTEETRDGNRANNYVDVKLKLENIIFEAVRGRGLAATIIQPSIVYGPFCWPWTNIPAEMLVFGEVVLPDRGEGLCNAVYIDDLIDGMLLAASSPDAIGERFIISGPEVVTWATFFTAIAEAVGTKLPSFWPYNKIVERNEALASGLQLSNLSPRRLINSLAQRRGTRRMLESCFGRLPLQLRRLAVERLGPFGRRMHQTYVPDQRALAFYTSKPVATCTKAHSRLGYHPIVDFASGMSFTESYLKWAYLNGQRTDHKLEDEYHSA